MRIFLPDTNILINALNGKRGHKELLNSLVLAGHYLACCAVTVSEVFSGIKPQDRAKVEAFISTLFWYDTTPAIASQAGRWRYEYARRGVILALPDMLIAVIAVNYSLTLITDNRKHFPMPELSIDSQTETS